MAFLFLLDETVNNDIQPKEPFRKNRIIANGKRIFFVVSFSLFTLKPNIICPMVPPKILVNKGSYKRKIKTNANILTFSGTFSKRENKYVTINMNNIIMKESAITAFTRSKTFG